MMWALRELLPESPPMPAELLPKLKCFNCKSYLSVFPISISEEAITPLCGRCKIPSTTGYMRDSAYEGIAQFLRFPCMNNDNGCKVLMLPEQLVKHEPRCIFRKLECPTKLARNCTWKGSPLELLKHYETSHKPYFLIDRKYPLDFTKRIDLQYLTVFQDEVFIARLVMTPDSEIFSCSVEHIPQRKDSYLYKYYITIETNISTAFYTIPRRKKAIIGSIADLTVFNRREMTEKLPAAKKLILAIELQQQNMDSLLLCELNDQHLSREPPVRWDQLENIKCEKCSLYIIPPIKQCSSGHTMCADCNVEATCHICKSPMRPNENMRLTQFASSLLYPCRYHAYGCKVILMTKFTRVHEETCVFKTFDCPFRDIMQCNASSSAPKTVHHVKNRHSKTIMTTDMVSLTIEDARHKLGTSFTIIYAARVFQVLFRYFKGSFMWAAIFVGPPRCASKFNLEVDIIDNSGRNLRMVARTLCTPSEEKKTCFEIKERNITLLNKQLELFTEKGRLCFKIRILKNSI